MPRWGLTMNSGTGQNNYVFLSRFPLATAAAAMIAASGAQAETPDSVAVRPPLTMRFDSSEGSLARLEWMAEVSSPSTVGQAGASDGVGLGERALAELIDDINAYKYLLPGWDGDSGVTPAAHHIEMTNNLEKRLARQSPIPRPMISSAGVIGLYWDVGNRFADIEIDSSGDISLFTKRRDSKLENFLEASTRDSASIDDLCKELESFFA